MDEKKQVQIPTWLGHPILDEGHSGELEQRAAIHEFEHKLPRGEAEAKAHEEYVKEHRQRAAAHHIQGMKAAQATGNLEDARKHYLLYELHAKALGHEPMGPIPPEIKSRMEDPDQKPMYRFKPHKGDAFALQDHKDSSPSSKPAEEHMDKAEVKHCRWRVGERRCYRFVGKDKDYCREHIDHGKRDEADVSERLHAMHKSAKTLLALLLKNSQT